MIKSYDEVMEVICELNHKGLIHHEMFKPDVPVYQINGDSIEVRSTRIENSTPQGMVLLLKKYLNKKGYEAYVFDIAGLRIRFDVNTCPLLKGVIKDE